METKQKKIPAMRPPNLLRQHLNLIQSLHLRPAKKYGTSSSREKAKDFARICMENAVPSRLVRLFTDVIEFHSL